MSNLDKSDLSKNDPDTMNVPGLICYTGEVTFFSFFQNLDSAGFAFLYGLSHRSVLFDAVGVFFATYAAYVVALALTVFFIWSSTSSRERTKNHRMVLVGIAAAAIARIVVKAGVVLALPRPRPFVALASVQPLITTMSWENLQSFPSGHTISFFALATVLYCFNKKTGWWAFGVAALIGISRIYVGVHWPSDILGGAVLGVLTGWAVYYLYRICMHSEKN